MSISRSEQFLQSKNQLPKVSTNMYKNVSDYRRNTLEEEMKNGKWRSEGMVKDSEYRAPSVVSVFAPTKLALEKRAAFGEGGEGGGFGGSVGFGGGTGSANTMHQMQAVYSPLWLNSNTNLPRDRATINAWCRSFFALHPWVANAINLHSTYPISKLSIKCKNKKVESFFNTMIEDLDLLNVCTQVAQEYWLLGEAFVYAELDSQKGAWSQLVIQNPDYIVVKKSVLANEPLIMLRPDENLRRIVNSNRPSDIEQKKQLNETIIAHIKRGENIPLDSFYVSHLARKISPYEVRGTGLPVSVFRQSMIFDLLRESKYVQAHSMINPLTVISVGAQADHRTNIGELEAWRETFAQAESNPNFKIITHDAVKIERIGFGQGIYDISGDITQLLKEIYIGLLVPANIIEGSGDIPYASAGVALDVLKQRYLQFRNMMSAWLIKKVFRPIAQLNEFYEYEDGEKKLILPTISWNHMSLFETTDYINVLVQLSTGDQKRVSQHTLYRSLGLEYDDERVMMRQEDIAEAVRQKELASLARMPLNELRTLAPDDEIPEITEDVNMAESPYTNAGQGPPGSDMSGGVAGGFGGGGLLPGLPGVSSAPPSISGAPTTEMSPTAPSPTPSPGPPLPPK